MVKIKTSYKDILYKDAYKQKSILFYCFVLSWIFNSLEESMDQIRALTNNLHKIKQGYLSFIALKSIA